MLDEPLKAIVEGERMAGLRRTIFGRDEATDSFICTRCSQTCSLSAKTKGFAFGSGVFPNPYRPGVPVQSAMTTNGEDPALGRV